MYLVRPAWDFSSPGWTISSLSASFCTPDTAVLNHLCGSSPDPLHWVHASLVVRSTALDPTFQICLTSAEQRGKIFSFNLLATFFQIQSRMSQEQAVNTGGSQLTSLPSRSPRSFFEKLLSCYCSFVVVCDYLLHTLFLYMSMEINTEIREFPVKYKMLIVFTNLVSTLCHIQFLFPSQWK